ncbi:unnamed protein product [Symbiodinium necroappetens]|uniref:Nucleotide-diphospho-sugar transferase domain-containing protein n=1 Tax=Symbiodinium necroappetens TaxID=1628268 RepID=A0A812ZIL3_9DINO|nr:unnamed protein product [Symbiodinium necroappetens]
MNSSCADIAVDLCRGGGRVFLLLLLDAEGGAERKWFSGHPGRYDLLLEEESLVDPRDFHPSWNKLAYARRVLILGDYDAVVCMDDDIFITNPRIDPIHDALVEHFSEDVTPDSEKLVVASLDEQEISRRRPSASTGECPSTLVCLRCDLRH